MALSRASSQTRAGALLARPTFATSANAARNLAVALVGAVIPASLVLVVFYGQWRIGGLYFDFEGTVWEPSRAALEGRLPFAAPHHAAVDAGNPAVYPPSILLVGVPFLALPFAAAAPLWVGLLVACVVAALWLVGVRDWRCYVAALVSWPVLLGAAFGNVTLLLVLAVALAWVYRDRPLVSGAAIGLAVALKLFLWPLALWLLATRRIRATAASAAFGAAALLVPWALIGFSGLRDYPALLRVTDDVFAAHSNSVFAGALGLGLPQRAAYAVAVAAGIALVAAVFALARGEDGARRSFAAAVAAALVLTPIVWAHYLALLLVPLAVVRPRFGLIWLAFPASWLVFLLIPLPRGTSEGKPPDVPAEIWEPLHAATPALWQTLGYATLAAVVIFTTLRARPGERASRG